MRETFIDILETTQSWLNGIYDAINPWRAVVPVEVRAPTFTKNNNFVRPGKISRHTSETPISYPINYRARPYEQPIIYNRPYKALHPDQYIDLDPSIELKELTSEYLDPEYYGIQRYYTEAIQEEAPFLKPLFETTDIPLE